MRDAEAYLIDQLRRVLRDGAFVERQGAREMTCFGQLFSQQEIYFRIVLAQLQSLLPQAQSRLTLAAPGRDEAEPVEGLGLFGRKRGGLPKCALRFN